MTLDLLQFDCTEEKKVTYSTFTPEYKKNFTQGILYDPQKVELTLSQLIRKNINRLFFQNGQIMATVNLPAVLHFIEHDETFGDTFGEEVALRSMVEGFEDGYLQQNILAAPRQLISYTTASIQELLSQEKTAEVAVFDQTDQKILADFDKIFFDELKNLEFTDGFSTKEEQKIIRNSLYSLYKEMGEFAIEFGLKINDVKSILFGSKTKHEIVNKLNQALKPIIARSFRGFLDQEPVASNLYHKRHLQDAFSVERRGGNVFFNLSEKGIPLCRNYLYQELNKLMGYSFADFWNIFLSKYFDEHLHESIILGASKTSGLSGQELLRRRKADFVKQFRNLMETGALS